MTTKLDALPKAAKKLPDDAKELFVTTYNQDFAWRCSESHAEKAAWRHVHERFEETEEGTWAPKS